MRKKKLQENFHKTNRRNHRHLINDIHVLYTIRCWYQRKKQKKKQAKKFK